MSAIWPSAVATTLQMLTAINNTKVTLTVDAGIADTTITVDDASPLPTSGYITFADNETNPETIQYTGISGNNLTGVTRAADNTAAGTHVAGADLEVRWNAAYHNTHSTEIIAIEQNLSDRFGTDSGTHTAKHVDGTFSLPSVTFASDTDSGLYRIGANDIALATNGTKALEVNATQQVVIPKTTNQLVLGTTNTSTISATAPSVSRTLTIPDPGSDASFVMTAGSQTIGGAKTFSAAAIFSSTVEVDSTLSLPLTSNQIVLGTTRTVTISAGTPASTSRTWTIPDITGNGTFAALEGTQTFSGAKTFSGGVTISTTSLTMSTTIAMGANKITGLANGTSATDAAAFGQLKVIQYVSATSTSSTATSSLTYVDCALTATITPTSSSNKVLIILNTAGNITTTERMTYGISRAGSDLQSAGLTEVTGASNFTNAVAIVYMDSPATTSATAYKLRVRGTIGTTVTDNPQNNVVTILLVEVA